jgi:hypothetical protein
MSSVPNPPPPEIEPVSSKLLGARATFVEQQLADEGLLGQAAPRSGGLFLTPAEMTELTGYQKASAQIRWLRERSYAFDINGQGRPVVLRDSLFSRLGGGRRETRPTGPRLRLDRLQ